MTYFSKSLMAAAALAASLSLQGATADAGVGDLLVAPTRIILTDGRGTQVMLNNIGDEEATYRISAELRRMTPQGQLEDVATPSEAERIAQEMVFFAPRRVTLAPNQPQAVRIAARAPAGLPDGEYRVHLLFRAVPKPQPVEKRQQSAGLSFKLIPVYGVTIPIIVRFGKLEVQAGISGARIEGGEGNKAVVVDVTRQGQRSVYGDIEVERAGEKEPIAEIRGVALYTEVNNRSIRIPVRGDYRGPLSGPVKITYRAHSNEGGGVIAEASTVLQ